MPHLNHVSVYERIRSLKIKLQLRSRSHQIGSTKPFQRGYGTEFHQLRDYQSGDDVRAIDWKSSAKTNKFLVKEHLQEQQYTIFILLDQSGSMGTATCNGEKYYTAQEIAGTLACVAQQTSSRVGILFFSEPNNHTIVPPRRGLDHYAYVLERIFSSQPLQKKQTSISAALTAALPFIRSDTLVCLISDCIDQSTAWMKQLALILKSPCLLFKIFDLVEEQITFRGIIPTIDAETNQPVQLNTLHYSTDSNDLLKSCTSIRLARGALCSVPVGSETLDITVPFISQILSNGLVL